MVCEGTAGGAGGSPVAVWSTSSDYVMICIPLFILMGNFANYSGIGPDLYKTALTWLGRMPGGLAMTTVFGNAAFGAVTGASLAGLVTFTPIAWKPMLSLNYDKRLAAGCLMSSGTLSQLIPPSLSFVVYSVVTNESVGRLFIAGIFPGILQAIMYALLIFFLTKFHIMEGPAGPSSTWKEKILSLKRNVGYAAAVFFNHRRIISRRLHAHGRGRYRGCRLVHHSGSSAGVPPQTDQSSRVRGAGDFGHAFHDPHRLDDLCPLCYDQRPVRLDCSVYRRGGFEPLHHPDRRFGSLSDRRLCHAGHPMVLLFTPLFFPILVTQFGMDPIWFGVIVVIMVELALVTPPVGLHLFAFKSLVKEDIDTKELWQGVIPFVITDLIRLVIMVAFPIISVWLPQQMYN